jgi:ABC-type multidrug transport system fused ATPase/permease subunit
MDVLSRLLADARPYRRQTILTYICLTAITMLNLVVPWLIKQAIDVGLARREAGFLALVALAILGVSLLRALFGLGQRYYQEWLSQHIAYDLRNRVYDKLQRLSFSYHDYAESGQLLTRGTSDVEAVQRFIAYGFLDAINMLLLFIGILAILLLTNWRLALISLLPMPMLAALTAYLRKRTRILWDRVQQDYSRMSNTLKENLVGAQVVRAFAREPYEIEKFGAANRDLMRSRQHVLRLHGTIGATLSLLITLSTMLVIWFGGREVIAGRLTVGALVAFNSYVVLLAMPVQRLTGVVNMIAEAQVSGGRIYEILHTPFDVKEGPDARELPPVAGLVRFENVSFRYANSKEAALQNISLEAQPGQIVALVGRTGAGKSSLVHLIPRFYDVSEGRITIDGIDIREVTLHSLRRQIGIVLQESLLFSATIRENIAFGHPQASMEEVIVAAQAARAHDFIMSFPDGYETMVGERGITLSGGQRQRIAIARALLINPRILILDDSTSSVDTETEHEIQRALATLMQGRTSFVIAQRLSTVKKAHQILVLDHGRIVERGTHEELLARGGPYRHIYDLQLRDQEEVARLAEVER